LSDRDTVGKLAALQNIFMSAPATVTASLFAIGTSHTHRLKQHTQVKTNFVSRVIVSN